MTKNRITEPAVPGEGTPECADCIDGRCAREYAARRECSGYEKLDLIPTKPAARKRRRVRYKLWLMKDRSEGGK